MTTTKRTAATGWRRTIGLHCRREFRTEERKFLSFLSLKQLKLRRNFREIQNLEGPEKPGSERHLAPESPEILKIASNSTTFNEITSKTW